MLYRKILYSIFFVIKTPLSAFFTVRGCGGPDES